MRRARFSVAISVVVLVGALAACGGGAGSALGGSSGGGLPPTSGTTPCPSGYSGSAPNCYPPGTAASVAGSLVDYSSGAPISGVPVSIVALATPQPYTTPAPAEVATTQSNGFFSFNATPGPYIVIIGSNSATDTRTTVHDIATLVPGPNALKAPGPWLQDFYANPAVESSGEFRTQVLSASQLDCLHSINSIRASMGAPALIPDEWLQEALNDTYASLALGGYSIRWNGVASFTEGGYLSCQQLGSWFSATPSDMWDPSALWFGGDERHGSTPLTQTAGLTLVTTQIDPRIDVPCTTAPASPAPTPGPNACDPAGPHFPGEVGYIYSTPSPRTVGTYGPEYTLPQPSAATKVITADATSQAAQIFEVGSVDTSGNTSLVAMAHGNAIQSLVVKVSSTGAVTTNSAMDPTEGALVCAMTDRSGNLVGVYQQVSSPYTWRFSKLSASFSPGSTIVSFPQQLVNYACPQEDINGTFLALEGTPMTGVEFNESGATTTGPSNYRLGTLDPITDYQWTQDFSGTGGFVAATFNESQVGSILAGYLPSSIYFLDPTVASDIAFDSQGYAWVAGDHRYDKVSLLTGSIVETIGYYKGNGPNFIVDSIMIDSQNDAWLITKSQTNFFSPVYGVVTEVSPTGAIIKNFYLAGTGGTGAAISSTGDLWVLNDPAWGEATVYPGIAPPGGVFSAARRLLNAAPRNRFQQFTMPIGSRPGNSVRFSEANAPGTARLPIQMQ